jgi:hypothetical protein
MSDETYFVRFDLDGAAVRLALDEMAAEDLLEAVAFAEIALREATRIAAPWLEAEERRKRIPPDRVNEARHTVSSLIEVSERAERLRLAVRGRRVTRP